MPLRAPRSASGRAPSRREEHPMKLFRAAALRLTVVACLIAVAPAAFANDSWTPARRSELTSPEDLVAVWLERVSEWLGWELVGPRPVSESSGGVSDPV